LQARVVFYWAGFLFVRRRLERPLD
jgi:hypothetical protein